MTYAELIAAVKSYVQNYETDFVAFLPTFVRQAETRIYNMVQLPATQKNATGAVTAGNKYLSCPADFLSVASMAVVDLVTGDHEYLLNKDVSFIRQAYPSPTATGMPRYYALFGPQSSDAAELSFLLAPTPDVGYTVELHYFSYPPSIVTAGTSWLGDNFDPALLYGTLTEAYTYMKGETDMVQLYDGKFKEAMQMATRLGDGLQRRDAYRNGQIRTEI